MRVTVISLIFCILLILNVSAIDFSFSAPESAEINEGFSVSISAENISDVYDVKIYVEDNDTEKTISEIYDENWRNPRLYIISAFPDTKDFDIRVINYSDNAQICVRLRKNGVTTTPPANCKLIEIQQSSQPNQNEIDEEVDNSSEESEDTETDTEENSSQNTEETDQDFIPVSSEEEQNQVLSSQDDSEKIFLSPKKSAKETFATSEGKLRNYALYSFVLLIILLCIYLAFKKF